MFGLTLLRARVVLCCVTFGFSIPIDRAGQAIGDNLSGIVQDSAGKPLSGAMVKVYASRPIQSSPTVVTILHPDCQLMSETDEQGRFEMQGITDDHQVMLVVWKTDHLISRTGYVSSTSEKIVIGLRAISEGNLPGRITGKICDSEDQPIANAVVGYGDAYASAKPVAVMTDSKGQFSLPSEARSFPVSLTAVIPKIGLRELRLHSPAQMTPQNSWTILPSVTVTGRIIDGQGAVPNYSVCVSTASSYGPNLLLTAATDSEGRFSIGGVPEGPDGLGRELEYCLFGDIAQANKQGHLETKRFDAGNNGEVLDFGDMRLGPVTSLTLKLQCNEAKLDSTKPGNNRSGIVVSLRQQCKSVFVQLNDDGVAKLENIPCEPLLIRIQGIGPYRFSDSNKYQRTFSDNEFYVRPLSQTELVVQMDKVK